MTARSLQPVDARSGSPKLPNSIPALGNHGARRSVRKVHLQQAHRRSEVSPHSRLSRPSGAMAQIWQGDARGQLGPCRLELPLPSLEPAPLQSSLHGASLEVAERVVTVHAKRAAAEAP